MMDDYNVEDLIRLFDIKDELSGEEYKEIQSATNFVDVLGITGSFFYAFTELPKMTYQYISPSIKQITGYDAEIFMEKGMQYTIGLISPDVAAIQKSIHFEIKKFLQNIPQKNKTDYKFCYNNIVKHADGHFVKIMQHCRFLKFNKEGIPLLLFSVVHEISDPNLEHKQVLTVSKLKNNKEKILLEKTFYPVYENRILTRKELEVWKLLGEGHSSKAIASFMNIKLNTVLTHRKKINKKLKLHKAQEL